MLVCSPRSSTWDRSNSLVIGICLVHATDFGVYGLKISDKGEQSQDVIVDMSAPSR